MYVCMHLMDSISFRTDYRVSTSGPTSQLIEFSLLPLDDPYEQSAEIPNFVNFTL